MFGEVVNGAVQLNDFGRIVQIVWDELPNHYSGIECDAFVVMPNHVHGIVVLTDLPVGAGLKPAPTRTHHGLGEIVRAFKTFSSRRTNKFRNTQGFSLWQRNYFEHVIRSEESFSRIRQYILDNPAQWEFDRENPAATQPESVDAWRRTQTAPQRLPVEPK
jgi:putative transposase